MREELFNTTKGDRETAVGLFDSWSSHADCRWCPTKIRNGVPEITLRKRCVWLPCTYVPNAYKLYYIAGGAAVRETQLACANLCADLLMQWRDSPERRTWLGYVQEASSGRIAV